MTDLDGAELRAWLKDAVARSRICGPLDWPIPKGVDPAVVLAERIRGIVAATSYAARDVYHTLSVRCDRPEGRPRAVTIFHDAGRDTLRLTWSPNALRVGGVRRYCLRVDPAEFYYDDPGAALAILNHLAGVVAAIVIPVVDRRKAA